MGNLVRRVALSLVLLTACGEPAPAMDGGATDAGLDLDAGRNDAGPADGGATTDAGASDAGALADAGPPDAGPGDGGPPLELCGVLGDEDGDGLTDCADPDCFDDGACHDADLDAIGLDRYTRCPRDMGQTFTAADSRAACNAGPSLVPVWSSDYRCDRLDYEGALTFFCPLAPTSGNDSVVVRYDVRATTRVGGPYTQEGRMSLDVTSVARRESRGDRHRHVLVEPSGQVRFIGYHWIGNIGRADGTATSDVWFRAAAAGPEIAGGGFHVDVDMSRLR